MADFFGNDNIGTKEDAIIDDPEAELQRIIESLESIRGEIGPDFRKINDFVVSSKWISDKSPGDMKFQLARFMATLKHQAAFKDCEVSTMKGAMITLANLPKAHAEIVNFLGMEKASNRFGYTEHFCFRVKSQETFQSLKRKMFPFIRANKISLDLQKGATAEEIANIGFLWNTHTAINRDNLSESLNEALTKFLASKDADFHAKMGVPIGYQFDLQIRMDKITVTLAKESVVEEKNGLIVACPRSKQSVHTSCLDGLLHGKLLDSSLSFGMFPDQREIRFAPFLLKSHAKTNGEGPKMAAKLIQANKNYSAARSFFTITGVAEADMINLAPDLVANCTAKIGNIDKTPLTLAKGSWRIFAQVTDLLSVYDWFTTIFQSGQLNDTTLPSSKLARDMTLDFPLPRVLRKPQILDDPTPMACVESIAQLLKDTSDPTEFPSLSSEMVSQGTHHAYIAVPKQSSSSYSSIVSGRGGRGGRGGGRGTQAEHSAPTLSTMTSTSHQQLRDEMEAFQKKMEEEAMEAKMRAEDAAELYLLQHNNLLALNDRFLEAQRQNEKYQQATNAQLEQLTQMLTLLLQHSNVPSPNASHSFSTPSIISPASIIPRASTPTQASTPTDTEMTENSTNQSSGQKRQHEPQGTPARNKPNADTDSPGSKLLTQPPELSQPARGGIPVSPSANRQ